MRDPFPPGLKAAEFTLVFVPPQNRGLFAGGGLPDACGLCRMRRRDDVRPVGGEGGGVHGALMSTQHRLNLPAGGRLPDARGLLSHYEAASGREVTMRNPIGAKR